MTDDEAVLYLDPSEASAFNDKFIINDKAVRDTFRKLAITRKALIAADPHSHGTRCWQPECGSSCVEDHRPGCIYATVPGPRPCPTCRGFKKILVKQWEYTHCTTCSAPCPRCNEAKKVVWTDDEKTRWKAEGNGVLMDLEGKSACPNCMLKIPG